MRSNKKGHFWSSRRKWRALHEAEGATSGMIAGAVIGANAGPPGMVAGAIIGGLAGVVAGAVLDNEASRQEIHTRELDAEIGVSGGDMGAPILSHPVMRGS